MTSWLDQRWLTDGHLVFFWKCILDMLCQFSFKFGTYIKHVRLHVHKYLLAPWGYSPRGVYKLHHDPVWVGQSVSQSVSQPVSQQVFSVCSDFSVMQRWIPLRFGMNITYHMFFKFWSFLLDLLLLNMIFGWFCENPTVYTLYSKWPVDDLNWVNKDYGI